ncbi:MAG: hypothetical protein U9Q72_01400 [Patescibacteria group bacterium]|nr:hypothetical protein [Patescibacteria group bacterium]
MKKNFFLFLALIVFLTFLIGVGYKKFNAPQKTTPIDSTDQKYLDQKASELKRTIKIKQSFCENPYFPIIPGANWKYNLVSDKVTAILEINAPALKDETQPINIRLRSTNQTAQTKLFCSPEGIIANSLTFLSASSLYPPEATVDIEIQEVAGFFLPKNLDKTTAWNFELTTIHRLITNENISADQAFKQDYQEKINITFNSVGEEKLDTLLGKIKTHRIDSWWIIEKNLLPKEEAEEENRDINNIANNNIEITMATCTFWVADQTGIVKSTYQEKAHQPIVLELRSFQIPAIQ